MLDIKGFYKIAPYLFLFSLLLLRLIFCSTIKFFDLFLCEMLLLYIYINSFQFEWNIGVVTVFGFLNDWMFLQPFGFSAFIFLFFILAVELQKSRFISSWFWFSWVKFTISLLVTMCTGAVVFDLCCGNNLQQLVSIAFEKSYFTILIYPAVHYLVSLKQEKALS